MLHGFVIFIFNDRLDKNQSVKLCIFFLKYNTSTESVDFLIKIENIRFIEVQFCWAEIFSLYRHSEDDIQRIYDENLICWQQKKNCLST